MVACEQEIAAVRATVAQVTFFFFFYITPNPRVMQKSMRLKYEPRSPLEARKMAVAQVPTLISQNVFIDKF